MARTPKPKSQRRDFLISAQVERELKQELEDIALREERPASEIIRIALKQYLRAQPKQAA